MRLDEIDRYYRRDFTSSRSSKWQEWEVTEISLGDLHYLIKVAKLAAVITEGLKSGDQDDLDGQIAKLAAALEEK